MKLISKLTHEEIAYHEAGHAVVCWFLGGFVTAIDMNESPVGHYGAFTTTSFPTDYESLLNEFNAMHIVAGPITQQLYSPRRDWGFVSRIGAGYDDWQKVNCLVGLDDWAGLAPIDSDRRRRSVCRRVFRLLREPIVWECVTVLANNLTPTTVLDEEDVNRFLFDSTRWSAGPVPVFQLGGVWGRWFAKSLFARARNDHMKNPGGESGAMEHRASP